MPFVEPYLTNGNHEPQSPFEQPRPSTPHPSLGVPEYPVNPNNSYDQSEDTDSTVDDYEMAWLCYRTYYIKEQRHLQRIAHYLWNQLSLAQRQSLLGSYSRIINNTIQEFATRRGIHEMHRRGWSYVTIRSEDLHRTEL